MLSMERIIILVEGAGANVPTRFARRYSAWAWARAGARASAQQTQSRRLSAIGRQYPVQLHYSRDHTALYFRHELPTLRERRVHLAHARARDHLRGRFDRCGGDRARRTRYHRRVARGDRRGGIQRHYRERAQAAAAHRVIDAGRGLSGPPPGPTLTA